MTRASKANIISRKIEFEGWHKLETLVVEHASLRHDGRIGPLRREMYYCGTCVIVLLYLPETDQILLNEQFRIGAYMGGEPNPWLYECCAGMMEKHRAAARSLRDRRVGTHSARTQSKADRQRRRPHGRCPPRSHGRNRLSCP